MKIGELARLAGTNVETIRYYERDGLLPVPARSEGNYRIYGEPHVQRLFFIRRCRGLDMTLDEIRVLLHFKESPQENCADVNRLLDRHTTCVSGVAKRVMLPTAAFLTACLRRLRLAARRHLTF